MCSRAENDNYIIADLELKNQGKVKVERASEAGWLSEYVGMRGYSKLEVALRIPPIRCRQYVIWVSLAN